MAIIRWGHETPITDIDWLWKPYIPFGKVTIVEGDGGDGKTTMILTVAAMLSNGQRPPTLQDGHLYDAEPIEPCTTFYLTNEDEISDSSLKRFNRAGGDMTRFAFSGELEYHMTLKEDELRDVISATAARLVIIDPFQSFLPEGTNFGSITRMRSIFTMLANVAKSTGAAIVLVGHLNKNEGSKDIHRGFGSADIAASVRSILMVEIDKHRNRFVRAIKSNFDESDYSPIQLVFDDLRRLSFKEVNLQDAPSVETKIDRASYLLESLLADGSMPVSEINELMEEEGIGAKTTQRARAQIGAVLFYDEHNIPCWKLG
ncbi:MAG: AAA family ATPase [Clostridia bacterium]|nr:AAA family ATPase [Clostridia bacterium]